MLDFGYYNMDCVEGMKQFPDNYFDLAIVDPPYGDAGKEFKGKDKSRFGGRFDKYKEDKPLEHAGGHFTKYGKRRIEWDQAPGEEYFKQLFRVSKHQVIWGGNYFKLPPTRCFLIWKKKTISENFTMAMAEYAWTSFNDNAKVFEYAPQGNPNNPRIHPTQKPVALYEWILARYASAGMKILDTHVGSGSSLIACHRNGFKYVGFEIDEKMYNKSKERLEAETAQMNIFEFIKQEENK